LAALDAAAAAEVAAAVQAAVAAELQEAAAKELLINLKWVDEVASRQEGCGDFAKKLPAMKAWLDAQLKNVGERLRQDPDQVDSSLRRYYLETCGGVSE
jgi:hypothetical protein